MGIFVLGVLWIASLVLVGVAVGGDEDSTQETAGPAGDEGLAAQLEDAEEVIADLEEQLAALAAEASEPMPDRAEPEADDGGDSPSALGSRSDPIPLGEPVRAGDWELVVGDVVHDAWPDVEEANRANDPPSDGDQFVMPRLHITYLGDDSEVFTASIYLAALGDSGRTYQDFSDRCGVIPDSLPYNELFEGGTVEGNWCVAVPEDDVGGLQLMVGGQGSTGSERLFLSLE